MSKSIHINRHLTLMWWRMKRLNFSARFNIPLSVTSCPWLFLWPQFAGSLAWCHPKNFCGPSYILMRLAQPCALTHIHILFFFLNKMKYAFYFCCVLFVFTSPPLSWGLGISFFTVTWLSFWGTEGTIPCAYFLVISTKSSRSTICVAVGHKAGNYTGKHAIVSLFSLCLSEHLHS